MIRKSENKSQKQITSKDSTALQAGRDITFIKNGITIDEARNISLDVFKANFYQLSEIAKEIALQRASEITEMFLQKLENENPNGIQRANDPDFQYSLFTIQKEYARNGDKDLGDLLVDLLVDRSKHKQRDILQIVLNESLITASKITENQIAALSLIFLIIHTEIPNIKNHSSLGEYFDKFILPVSSKIIKNISCYRHLAYSGCGTISTESYNLARIYGIRYQGLFLKGFEEKEIEKKGISIGCDSRYFKECLNDPTKIQLAFINKEALSDKLKKDQISPDDQKRIISLFDVGKMSNEEIGKKCIEIRPFMANVFDVWSNSEMKKFRLSSVGIAIGHANIKRFFGEFADLSIWIN